MRNGRKVEEGRGERQCRVFQPSGQRIDSVGQSKHGGVEFVCDMERRDNEEMGNSDERGRWWRSNGLGEVE